MNSICTLELGRGYLIIFSQPISTAGSALAAGILGTLAAIVPAATVGGGFGAGVATFAGGLITLMNDKLSVEL